MEERDLLTPYYLQVDTCIVMHQQPEPQSMATDNVYVLFFLLAFLCIQLIKPNVCDGALISGCFPAERSALLEFKRGLKDPTNRLSSWVGEDCCRWEGVTCSNHTGHVVKLDLQNPHPFSDFGDEPYNDWTLGGELRPSLLGLKHLKYLDLSMNDFGGISIPEFMGSFHQLQYLNLSRAGLRGLLPHQLGNLSNLQYLDLNNDNFVAPTHQFSIGDALWISHLASLKHLNLNNVKFQNGTHWLEALNMLPSIVEIYLYSCEIPSVPLSLPHVNFTSLSVLDLSYNSINSTIPSWLFNISGLEHLDLSENNLQGNIPPTFGNLAFLEELNLAFNSLQGGIPTSFINLCRLQNLILSGINISKDLLELDEIFSGCIKMKLEILDLYETNIRGQLPEWLFQLRKLKVLDLGWNLISGPIPASIGQLASLQDLSLAQNQLNETIPESVGWLSQLVTLDLEHNNLEGVMSVAHFGNLTELKYLTLSSNSLALKVKSNWLPPFRLESLWMGSCKQGPEFPAWLQSQINISQIVMSNASIIDAMPNWFWSLISTADYVSVSGNQISGHVPNLLHLNNLYELDLSSNYFEGPLPYFPSGLSLLDLSNNSFSGTISLAIFMNMPKLLYLSLSKNNLSGEIPFSICKLSALKFLDLSKNMLSGELPSCWNDSSPIEFIDFSSNNISGVIPESICSIASLQSVHLSNNSLSGGLPLCLKDCKKLVLLDAGHNDLKGEIPTWIGESLTSLRFLNLRSNMLARDIPPNLSRLSALQFLDLADNKLSGTIPRSFGNFTAMKVIGKFSSRITDYKEQMFITTKGNTRAYDESLSLMNILDLSDNNLFGGVPEELTNLFGLFSLNLSGNHFTGEIIENISKLQQLESLDLSRNNFSGTIPSSLTALTSLSYLNFSYNNLSGKIPLGNQLLTFDDPSSYIGNPGLCGFPLNQSCNVSETARDQSNPDDRDEYEMIWFYTSMAPGFVVGFWAVWGTLILNKNWNLYYFRFIDNMLDKVYVFTVLKVSRIRKRCCSHQG
ncbi:receptor-like protein EIX2 isoform X1 [Musa acuminata AAA Group]|uniref:receptor-like protein EIX2 isoform X1 n=1 Tax=Musa acuminata AAA Group TaxID=214697 RepID=UPI0031DD4F53